MARLNPILLAQMESLETTEVIEEVSEEQAQAFEEGQELSASEKAMDDAHDDLNAVETAISDMEKLQEAQEKNVQIMEGTVSEEVPASEPESQPVEGGVAPESVEGEVSEDAEVNEAVMSEPLPENEDQAVEVIDEQIQNEELVMESIAASLGFKAKFGNSATKQLYAGLGIRTSKTSRGVGMESRNAAAGAKKERAIQAYKSHCEGIGDAVKKMGSAVWSGIVKLMKAVMDFIHKIISNANNIIKKFTTVEVKIEDIIKNPDNYKLTDVFTKGYTDVTAASVLVGCVNPSDAVENALNLTGPSNEVLDILIGIYTKINSGQVNPEEIAGMLSNLEKISSKINHKPLKFEGVEFNDSEMKGVFLGTGIYYQTDVNSEGVATVKVNEAKSVNIKFSSVKDLAERMKLIVDAFDAATVKKIANDGQEVLKKCKALHSLLEKAASDSSIDKEEVEKIKKDTSGSLKQTKAIYSIVQTAVSALALLGTGLEK